MSEYLEEYTIKTLILEEYSFESNNLALLSYDLDKFNMTGFQIGFIIFLIALFSVSFKINFYCKELNSTSIVLTNNETTDFDSIKVAATVDFDFPDRKKSLFFTINNLNIISY